MKIYKYLGLYFIACIFASAESLPKSVFFKISHDKAPPYVNQQWLYTVKLYANSQLVDSNYIGPEVENAFMLSFGNTRHYTQVIEGIQYNVEEQTYAIFPQKSGEITIKSPVFKTVVMNDFPEAMLVRAKNIRLHVKPAMEAYPGKYWFVASGVKIKSVDNYEKYLYKVGEVIVENIEVEAAEAPFELIPRLHFQDSKAYKLYVDKPVTKNKIIDDKLVGTLSYKITIILHKKGKVKLPEITLPWFDYKNNKVMVTKLAAKSIKVVD